MIGKIVVVLLPVLCFNCMLTEALLSDCLSYKPKASFANITGLAYAEEYSVIADFPCLTLNIKTLSSNLVLKAYNATNTFGNAGNLTSRSFLLLENPLVNGQGGSFLPDANGVLARIVVVVGYVGDSSGFRGYALAACGVDGSNNVAIVLKNPPPDSAVVSELKAQLPSDLLNIPLIVISHGNTCVYAP